jgi:hypothetical protein
MDVATSDDGGTALVGSFRAGVSVFRRSADNWVQDGPALIGGDNPEQLNFGCSVALSADGRTAIAGDPGPHGTPGSAWVFTLSGDAWTRTKLEPTPIEDTAVERSGACHSDGKFGSDVALSADGNTVLVGEPQDGAAGAALGHGAHAGSAWVFTRSGGGWTQQGAKLTANDEVGDGNFGTSLALSADGDVALIGAPSDIRRYPYEGGHHLGAAWIFTRSGSAWHQQDTKLAPRDEHGEAGFGASVSLSADGTTALIGGPADDVVGSAWVYQRVGADWLQSGPKLDSGEQDYSGQFGESVALSSDGETAVIAGIRFGGYQPDSPGLGPGVVRTFARAGNTWIRQTPTLRGPSLFGSSVALSGDGTAVLIGDPDGGSGNGAVFVATNTPQTNSPSFSLGLLTIKRDGRLVQQLPSSSAGTYAATATVGARALAVSHPHGRPARRSKIVTYGTGRATSTGPSAPVLTIKPRAAVRAVVAKHKRLTLSVTIRFRPAAGVAPPPQTRKVVVEDPDGSQY